MNFFPHGSGENWTEAYDEFGITHDWGKAAMEELGKFGALTATLESRKVAGLQNSPEDFAGLSGSFLKNRVKVVEEMASTHPIAARALAGALLRGGGGAEYPEISGRVPVMNPRFGMRDVLIGIPTNIPKRAQVISDLKEAYRILRHVAGEDQPHLPTTG